MDFVKMHGLGNDFIVVEESKLPPMQVAKLAQMACDRHLGVGADGLVVLGKSSLAPWRMQIFNSDGTEAEMCGNALRCVGKYLYDNNLISTRNFDLETHGSTIRNLRLTLEENIVRDVEVDMGKPILQASRIPIDLDTERVVDAPIKVDGKEFKFTGVSMGNPHIVIFVPDVDKVPLEKWGTALENHPLFPRKTNVEFVQVLAPDRAKMLVWERGVGPTQACGSGACAVLVAGVLTKNLDRKARIQLPGGRLLIHWNEHNHVTMSGPAESVFRGKLDINYFQKECSA